jgi:hypothetical protein
MYDLSSVTFWSLGFPDTVRDIQLLTISEDHARLKKAGRTKSSKSQTKTEIVPKQYIRAFRSLHRVHVSCKKSTKQQTWMSQLAMTESLRRCFKKKNLEVVFIHESHGTTDSSKEVLPTKSKS